MKSFVSCLWSAQSEFIALFIGLNLLLVQVSCLSLQVNFQVLRGIFTLLPTDMILSHELRGD